jgi:hypothetical protein
MRDEVAAPRYERVQDHVELVPDSGNGTAATPGTDSHL